MRGSRGPRQPGGGKQSAGPRHRHGSRHPEVRAKRATKSAAADLAPRSSKSGKPDFSGSRPGTLSCALRALSSPASGGGRRAELAGRGSPGPRVGSSKFHGRLRTTANSSAFRHRLSPSQWRARRAEENQPPCRSAPSPATKPACASTAFSKPAFRA